MCRNDLRRGIGISVMGFGIGILCSFLLPWGALAWLESAVVLALGLLWLKRC